MSERRPLTAQEFAQQYGGEYVELIDGVVEELPVSPPRHGNICYRVAYAITHFADVNDCGHVTTNDSFVRTSSDRVRGADVCFFTYARVPKGPFPQGLLPVAPNLIAEVRSPAEKWEKVMTKSAEYLSADVSVVAVLDDATRSVTVLRSEAPPQVFHAEDALTIPDLLPGFSVIVGRLFE